MRGNALSSPPERVDQQARWQEQLTLYRDCPNVDLIYVFIIEGYQALLAGIIPFKMLTIERAMRDVLEAAATNVRVRHKVQIVGIDELIPTLTYLQDIAEHRNQPLNNLLLGAGKDTYYDSPKMIEAFVRLARGFHIRSEEVILRFDEDVAVNQDSIDALIDYHNTLPYGKSNDEFRFLSGNYLYHNPRDLLNDYAVRTHHFAQVGAQRLNPKDSNYGTAKQWLDSIVNIGANPHNQVISGAGLSMSLKSIMTLPPFANAGSPIIWIDDHLKRLLHEALGHLDPLKKANPPMDVSSYRCCKDASFEQDRYPDGVQQGDINWAVNEYLPRLVRGCVMDILIWDRSSPGAGLYTNYVDQVLNGAPVPDKVAFGRALEPESKAILDKIITQWSNSAYHGYPLYSYATNELPKQTDKLVDEIVEAFHSYLNLLHIWPRFALLWQNINPTDPQNRWLYHEP